MAADPVRSLAARVGNGVTLERPSDPEHGDYATNAALRLAGARRQAPRELAAELVTTAESLPEVGSVVWVVAIPPVLARDPPSV